MSSPPPLASSPDPDAPATNRAVETLQRQIDALAQAHDARAERAQVALDDLTEIVCDPLNPYSHERRITVVETKQDAHSAHGRASLLDIIPSAEDVGAYATGFAKWGPRGLLALLIAAVLYSYLSGHMLDQYERLRAINARPVQVDVNLTDQNAPRIDANSRRIDSLARVDSLAAASNPDR